MSLAACRFIMSGGIEDQEDPQNLEIVGFSATVFFYVQVVSWCDINDNGGQLVPLMCL